MKTWVKISLALIAAGFACVAAALIALRILYPPERIKEIAVTQLVKSLGREIKLADASIGLRGVSLGALEVSEVPNFDAGTAATLKSLTLKIDWRPLLLEKKVRVTELSIDGLALVVIADKDGALNVAKTGERSPRGRRESPAPDRRTAPKSAPPELLLERLSVSDGSVRYEDRKTGMKASVSGLALNARGANLTKPFPLELGAAFAVDGKKGKLDLKGTLDPHSGNFQEGGADIEALGLVWDGKRYTLAGKIAPFSAPAGKLRVGLPALEAGGVAIPALSGTLTAAYKNELAALTKIDLNGDGASLKGNLLQTKAGWKLDGVSVSLEGFSALLDGVYAPEAIDLRVRSEKLDLAKAGSRVAALKEMNAAGTASVDLKVKGKPESPALSGKATLSGASLNASGQALAELNGLLAFTPGDLSAKLNGKLNGAAFDASLSAKDYSTNRPRVELTGTLAKLDLSKLPESSSAKTEPAAQGEDGGGKKPPSKTLTDAKGSITIGAIVHPRFQASKTTMRWDLTEIGSDLSKLDGTVSFNVGAGKFDDLKRLGASNGLVKVVLLPIMIIQNVATLVKVPLFPNFDRVEFKEIVGDYGIKNGLMTVKQSHLDSSVGFVTMTGKADLAKEALDLKVNAKLSGALKAPVSFTVKGTISDPKVKLDAASVLKQPEVNKALEQGRELLKKQGDQLLKGLFGR